MKKYLFFALCFILSSCQSSINENFEKAIKEATGKSVSYEEHWLEASRVDNDSTELYMYRIELNNKDELDIVRDYVILCRKLDSIMTNDYNCNFSSYKVERFKAMQNIINGYEIRDGLISPGYHWYGDSVGIDVSVEPDDKEILLSIFRTVK